MIRVLIADDHGIVRSGLRMLLERQPDIRVVGEADDGVGFDASAIPRAGTTGPGVGLGLSGMAERARLVGGELDVRSAPGGGTTVAMRVQT